MLQFPKNTMQKPDIALKNNQMNPLLDALGDRSRMKQIKQKYGAGYENPKPKHNQGMRGVGGEIYL